MALLVDDHGARDSIKFVKHEESRKPYNRSLELTRLDRWIDEELLKCDWLMLEIVCLIPELYNWKVPEPHKLRVKSFMSEHVLKLAEAFTSESPPYVPSVLNINGSPAPRSRIGDGQDPGIPDTPELMLEGQEASGEGILGA